MQQKEARGPPKCQRAAQSERLQRREHPACSEHPPACSALGCTCLGRSWTKLPVPSSRLPGRWLKSRWLPTRGFLTLSFGEMLTFPKIVVSIQSAVSSRAAERGLCPWVAVRGRALCEHVRGPGGRGVLFCDLLGHRLLWVTGREVVMLMLAGNATMPWSCRAGDSGRLTRSSSLSFF